MSLTQELSFVALAGIIDPLRAEAKEAVRIALAAGIDVRMITGDHAVTAHAIGESLGLGEGAISGAELQALSDEELRRRLPRLHVFGRVTPEDKLRLARIMQGEGLIVAMTGDAVNDAAALKQADIGVAMGSGSEVTKQASRMILTDDNFGTLVHAVELGRSIYGKVVSYIRYQMSQLLALVLLFVTATVFNINSGVAMTPLMVLFLNFFVAIFPVVVIMLDPPDPDIMNRPPRDPKVPITNGAAVTRWVLYGAVLFLAALVPLIAGPDQPTTDAPSAAMTMCYVVIGLGTIFSGVVMRRDPTSGLIPPILTAVKWSVIPAGLLVLSTELDFLQNALLTQRLSGLQWLACIGLGLVMPVVVEVDKVIRRRRLHPPAPEPVEVVVAPVRATVAA
jgi:Ca2+-transporting ATPase